MHMGDNNHLSNQDGKKYVSIAIDLILKVGTLFLVIYLCFRILKPFLSMLTWGLIIAIILFPIFHRLRGWLGKRNKISSILLTALSLSMLVLPSIWLVNQLVEGVRFLGGYIQEGTFYIPAPTDAVADWPLIGPWLYENWLALSQNMGESIRGFLPQIASWSEKILRTLATTGLGILQFAASIIIAGIFLIFFEQGADDVEDDHGSG